MAAEVPILVDTGPLVAWLLNEEAHHAWVVERFRELPAPFLTCESVLSETFFLVRRLTQSSFRFVELLEIPLLSVSFDLREEKQAVGELMRKYADLPMSLADACLVRMAELHDRAAVFTLDRQFRIYRKHGRRSIPTIAPWAS